jgi:hypothetical protein
MKFEFHFGASKIFAATMFFAGCAPTVYLIDRQTVLEIEASGDWQELDQKFHQNQLTSGPLPLEKTHEKAESSSIYAMTHSDNDKTSPATSAPDVNKAKTAR